MDSLSEHDISQRAISGVMVLVARKAALKTVNTLGGVFLARLLSPQDWGVFGIITFILTFFTFFSDIGLGAALIQQKEKLTKRDLAATFAFQQLLVVGVLGVMFLVSPWIIDHYELANDKIWLIRVVSLSLLFTSLKTIPAISLERNLLFGRLVIPEVVEVVSFQLVAIVLAVQGFGVWSFIYALVVRSFLGMVTMYWISPWRPQLAWDYRVVKRLVKFGIPFQMNGVVAFIKDAVTPLFVGSVAGSSAVGYLNWANTYSKLPIEFMSDIFRVTFPTYSRIQDNTELLKKAVEKTIRFVNLIVYPTVAVLAATAPQMVHIVFTDKWEPALLAFYLHLFAIPIVGIANVFMDTFWALGKTKLATWLLIVYTVINWAVSVPLVYWIGFNGAMVGSVVVLWVSLPLTIYHMRSIVSISIWPQIKNSLLSGLVVLGVTYWLSNRFATTLWSLFAVAGFGGLLYVGVLLLIERQRLAGDMLWLSRKANVPIPRQIQHWLQVMHTERNS